MSKPLEEIFRENLKFYRKQRKLSQERLSAALDKNIYYINMIESGKSLPPIGMIEQIAKVLKIRPAALFEQSESSLEQLQIHQKIEGASAEIARNVKEMLEFYFLQGAPC